MPYARRVSATRHTLEQLRRKYGEMLSMRLAHESGEETETRAQQRMAELAAQFPGALREIDDLEMSIIRDRIARLDAALQGEREIELWMEAIGLFHSLARGALQAKRWLAGRKSVSPDTVSDYCAEQLASTRPAMNGQPAIALEALAWADDLARIASPPRGRVMDLVFARIAQALGTTEPEARTLVFGTPRRSRRAPE
jgi:hypothetical protein